MNTLLVLSGLFALSSFQTAFSHSLDASSSYDVQSQLHWTVQSQNQRPNLESTWSQYQALVSQALRTCQIASTSGPLTTSEMDCLTFQLHSMSVPPDIQASWIKRIANQAGDAITKAADDVAAETRRATEEAERLAREAREAAERAAAEAKRASEKAAREVARKAKEKADATRLAAEQAAREAESGRHNVVSAFEELGDEIADFPQDMEREVYGAGDRFSNEVRNAAHSTQQFFDDVGNFFGMGKGIPRRHWVSKVDPWVWQGYYRIDLKKLAQERHHPQFNLVQQRGWDCGPHATAWVMAAFGFDFNALGFIAACPHHEIIRGARVGPEPSRLRDHANSVAHHFGYHWESGTASVGEILYKSRENPIVVLLRVGSLEGGISGPALHYAVIEGYDAQNNRIFMRDSGDFNSKNYIEDIFGNKQSEEMFISLEEFIDMFSWSAGPGPTIPFLLRNHVVPGTYLEMRPIR